jgi:hypothetical protein
MLGVAIMLRTDVLTIVMVGVINLSVIKPNVVAPLKFVQRFFCSRPSPVKLSLAAK